VRELLGRLDGAAVAALAGALRALLARTLAFLELILSRFGLVVRPLLVALFVVCCAAALHDIVIPALR
jgi:hypothetical protein